MRALFIGRPAAEARCWVSARAERLGTDWRVCCWVINKVVWGLFNKERGWGWGGGAGNGHKTNTSSHNAVMGI